MNSAPSRSTVGDTSWRGRRAAVSAIGDVLSTIPDLRCDTWRHLNLESRVVAMQKVSDAVTGHFGAPSVDLGWRKGGIFIRGSYDHEHNSVDIGKKLLMMKSPRASVGTTIHEARHAVQRAASLNPVTAQQRRWRWNMRRFRYVGAAPILLGNAWAWAAGALKPVAASVAWLAPVAVPAVANAMWLAMAAAAAYRLQPLEIDAFGFQRACRAEIRRVTGGRRYQLPCRVRDVAVMAAALTVFSGSQSVVASALAPSHSGVDENIKMTQVSLPGGRKAPGRTTFFVRNMGTRRVSLVVEWVLSDDKRIATLTQQQIRPSWPQQGSVTPVRYHSQYIGAVEKEVTLAPRQTLRVATLPRTYKHSCSNWADANGVSKTLCN